MTGFSVFVLPIVYLLRLRHDVASAIATASFGFCGIIVLWLVFGVKYASIFRIFRSQITDLQRPYSVGEPAPSGRSMTKNLTPDMVRTMTPEEQYEYYTQQIQKFTNLRLELAEGNSTHSQIELSKSAAFGNHAESAENPHEIEQCVDPVYSMNSGG
jgi:hypothetical protein